jgi:Ca2+/Na+ antiporter
MPLSPEEQKDLLKTLDSTRRGLLTVYRSIIIAVIAVVTVFAVFLYFKIQNDAFRGFLTFYFGILFLIFLFWAFGQLAATRRSPSEEDLLDIELKKQEAGPVKTYTLRIGNAPAAEAASPAPTSGEISGSHSFKLQVGNLPIEPEPIDEGLLALADEYVRQGKSLEWVCGVLSPKYRELGTVGQEAYRAFFQASLEAWRAKAYGSTATPAAEAPIPPVATPTAPTSDALGKTAFERPHFDRAFDRAPSPAAPKEHQPARGLFTKAEVLVFVVVFLSVCAAIITALILFQGATAE